MNFGKLGWAALSATATAAFSLGTVFAGGVSGPAFYVDGVLYRTVATPTDLAQTGAPESTFDIIYQFSGAQPNVADAAPGDPGFNGGRWAVHLLELQDYAGALGDDAVDLNQNEVLDSDEEVRAGIVRGYLADLGVVRRFVCTVNKVPPGQQ